MRCRTDFNRELLVTEAYTFSQSGVPRLFAAGGIRRRETTAPHLPSRRRRTGIAIAESKCALALTTAEKFIDEPFYFVAPQVIKGKSTIWEPSELNLLLEHLKSTLSIDANRIYLTGHSMGGYGTWVWAATNPQLFAAVAPNAGGLGSGGPVDITPDFVAWAKNLTKVPLWAFHGVMDKTVPVDRSESMVKAIKENGGTQVKLTLYPDLGHNSANTTHANPELYRCLFSHRRSS